MPMNVQAKICGITDAEGLTTAIENGARFVGFVFYPASPRYIAPARAAELARLIPTSVRSVGLFVDAPDDLLTQVSGQVPFDMLQLHGKETPQRVSEIKSRFHLPVMKAVKIAAPEDLSIAAAHISVADRLLFDARPPATAGALPGGNGVTFDWTLLAGHIWSRPWMLSGGLNAGNVAQGVKVTGALAVDVSSGVEDSPGHKDPKLIREFLKTVAAL